MKIKTGEWGKDRRKLIALRLTEGEKTELLELTEAEVLSHSELIRKHLLRERRWIEGPVRES